ncbi:MAG TPA: flippase activity-associated protein Agl23 [Chloroflexia bacterium]|nr:flippase activity-associated protein Agl23 [Chloroflexia bacterium]
MKTQSRPSREQPPESTLPDEVEASPSAPVASTGTLPVRTTTARRATPEAPAPIPPAVDGEAPVRRGPLSWLTLENGLYLLFFALALITRFWDLDAKGLHHDESLHAVFSWKYYTDLGYIHSPMMHGPEQFHFIDLFFLLFGATDATARFASAACGVFLVMSPWFLRRQLGRWPALIASFLILISPGFMYFTRFAREDAIYAAMEMIFILGLWRFVDERKPRDFYVMCAGYALMFTIKESAYLTTAVVGLLIVGLFAWQMGRWMFATFAGYLMAAGALALIILKMPGTPKLPNIPAQDPTPDNISAFVNGLLAHPLIQVMAGVTVLWLAVWGYLLWDQSNRIRRAAYSEMPAPDEDELEIVETNGHLEADAEGADTAVLDSREPADGATSEIDGEETFDEGEPAVVDEPRRLKPRPAPVVRPAVPGLLERYQPGSLPYAAGYLLRNPIVLGTGAALAALIYVALYTSLFTNINGIGTGLFGSIGYWLAQQDVRRGDQPWFYYFLLIPVYEPLIIFFTFTGLLYFAGKGIRVLQARRYEPRERGPVVAGATSGWNVGKPVDFAEFRPFLVLFLATWFIGTIGLYSWAGEKMPWLMIHMVQPMAFLAALGLGQLIKSMIRNRRYRADMYVEPMAEDAPRNGGRRSEAAAIPAASPWAALIKPTSWVPFFSFLALFLVISAFWAMSITHRVVNNDYENWWQLLIWPALLLLLSAAYWSLVGGGRVLRYVLVAVLCIFSIYGIRSAIQLSFYNAMDAREMAVYVQTSPDVTRAADTIDRLSVDQTGTRDLKVMYDSQTSWPWEWYLRDYKNKQFNPGGPTTAPAPDVAVLVVDSAWYDKAQSGQAPQLDNYVGTKYAMRWWFPEDTYRRFVPDTWDEIDPAKPVKDDGSINYKLDAAGKQIKAPVRQIQGALDTILYTLRTPEEQGKLWKYLIYRQPYAALGSTDMAVFVRKDLVARYNYLAGMNLPNYDSLLSH